MINPSTTIHMMMVSPLVGRTPTCLSCIRRINTVGSGPLALTQVRGKKTERKTSKGVVVRLLENVPKYGKEGSIMHARPGIMRNQLFPRRQAEYLTRDRMRILGLTKDDIGLRDTQYGVKRASQEAEIEDAVDHVAGDTAYAPPLPGGPESDAPGIEAPVPAIEIEQIPPNRALELMEALIPDPIIFERRLIHNRKVEPAPPEPQKEVKPEPEPEPVPVPEPVPEPVPQPVSHPVTPEPQPEKVEPQPDKPREVLSPLQRRRLQQQSATVERAHEHPAEAAAEVVADKAKDTPATSPLDTEGAKTPEEVEKERKQLEKDAEELLKIHGSVTLANVASYLLEKMLLDPEASRIRVQADEIKFVGLEDGVDQVKKIGSFEVEIRTHVSKMPVDPVRRRVEVVPSS